MAGRGTVRPVRFPAWACWVLAWCGAVWVAHAAPPSMSAIPGPPELRRELRGAWIATKGNIDWPSKPGLKPEQQRQELLEQLDLAAEIGLNAVILQVRPQGDALYRSALEPWSEYLTGREGVAPSPAWDPLAFAVDAAHERGMELHAWINPFRARAETARSPSDPRNMARRRPALAIPYGNQVWMDPGSPEVQRHALSVIADLVRRYDIDALHMDDYFYPYPIKDGSGAAVPFLDDATYREHGRGMDRGEWRRANVDGFVRAASRVVHETKPWVQFGVSPFGIWRNNVPPGIKGLDAFESLHADARRWLAEGWVDYLAPQLYWNIEQTAQSFHVLMHWWAAQNRPGRNLYAGIASARVGVDRDAREIGAQAGLVLEPGGANGLLLWNMSSLMDNKGGVVPLLKARFKRDPAVPPASPWLTTNAPALASFSGRAKATELRLSWTVRGGPPVRSFALQVRRGVAWSTLVLPPGRREMVFRASRGLRLPDEVQLVPVGRAGIAGRPGTWRR